MIAGCTTFQRVLAIARPLIAMMVVLGLDISVPSGSQAIATAIGGSGVFYHPFDWVVD